MLKSKIKRLWKGFKFAHSLSIKVIPVTILDAFLRSALPFVSLFMSAYIIEALINRRPLMVLIGLTVVIQFIVFILAKSTTLWKERCSKVMLYNSDMKINEKIMSMDYAAIEDPKTHLLRKKIDEYENMSSGGPYNLMHSFSEAMSSLFTIGIALIMMPAILIRTSVNSVRGLLIFISVVVICMLISIGVQSRNSKKLYSYFGEVMDANRIYDYYQGHVSDYNSGKGIRLYHQESLLINSVRGFIENSMSVTFNMLGTYSALMLGASTFFSTFASGLVFFYVGLMATNGVIPVSGILKYIGGIMLLMKGTEVLVRSFVDMSNNMQYLEDYFEFFDIETQMYHGTLPVEKRDDDAYEIAFKNVSFKYPGTDVYVLKNVTLDIPIGERLAIVGMNGSGKTTLIKLLCRLYDPTEGEITLNGINIQKYDYEEYLSLFSVVFQDFKLFAFSLGQNVGASMAYDAERVKSIMHQVGLDERLEKMAKGLETYLYKHFDVSGEEMSGGEGQKIALARAVYRDAPMVILDEPTSALDPIAEFEIYSKFNEIVRTKTAFYISHRLSSCRFCDSIAVFHEGELVQRGHHDELVTARVGKYRELWMAQAQYYSEQVV